MKKSNNIKTPIIFRVALVLLCILFVTSYMISGLYARLSTTVTGTATGQTATIDFRMSENGVFNYSFQEEFNGSLGGVYAVIVEFDVTNTGQVAYDYTLKLRLSNGGSYETAMPDAYITLAAPRDMTNVNLMKESNLIELTTVNTITSTITKFVDDYAYYAVSSDGVNYTWLSAKVANDGTLTCEAQELGIGNMHYYKLIYFIHMKPETQFKNMTLYCSSTCEQID